MLEDINEDGGEYEASYAEDIKANMILFKRVKNFGEEKELDTGVETKISSS